jgi:sporulation protein YlmC with PRC-barrel domain
MSFSIEENLMMRVSKPRIAAALLVPAVGLALVANASGADRDTRATLSRAPSQEAQAAGRNVRASKLIGMDVRNAQGERLGEIKDLVIDVNNDRVHYAILSFGGFLGLGDKLFAYPVRSFTQTGDGDKLVLNVEKSRLKGAPGFEKDRNPDWSRYGEEVERYHGATVAVRPMPNAVLRRASELIGKDVNDRNGKDVGEIDDVVVNMRTGAVPYAVLEFDRSWNLNDKLLPVPLRALDFSTGRQDLVMNVDKERLDTAKAFDQRRWPDINDPKYMAEVRQNLATMVPMTREKSAGRSGSRPETPQGYTGPRSSTGREEARPSAPGAGTSESGGGSREGSSGERSSETPRY